MLSIFRRFLNTWAARALFVVLVLSFGAWGIADVIRNLGQDTSVATVGGQAIEVPEVQTAFQRQLAQVARTAGNRGEVPAALRRTVLDQTVQTLVTQAAMHQEVAREGLAVPDDALRAAIFAAPQFQGSDGKFSRANFDGVLRQNGLTEPGLLAIMRSDLGVQQLVDSVTTGVAAPASLAERVYAFQHETRTADVVTLLFAAAPMPAAPTADDLQRYYENNAIQFSAPEYRRIKAVILSPATIARNIAVPDADARAYYQQHIAEWVVPEKRSVEVVVAGTEQAAATLAAQWRAGADWAAIKAAAKPLGASTVALADAPAAEFPSPALASAVFTAHPGDIVGPTKAGLGWQVFHLAGVMPGRNTPFEGVKAEIDRRVAEQRGAEQLDDRIGQLQDALSANASLEKIPSDIGAVALQGTLDPQGNTPAGDPAPLPGPAALRDALIGAAFKTPVGAMPNLVEGPNQAWYAMTVLSVTPAAKKPFAAVAAQVRTAWLTAQRRHEQDVVAARVLSAVQSGGSLADAALVNGLRVDHTPTVSRGDTLPDGVSLALAKSIFSTPKGKPNMVETPDGFDVLVTTAVTYPAPGSDAVGLGAIRDALSRSLANDVAATYITAIRDRGHPRVNPSLLATLAQP